MAYLLIILVILIPLLGIVAATAWFFRTELRAIMLARRNRHAAIECRRCRDCCCKTVVVSHYDLARLQEFTGSASDDFAVRLGFWKQLKKSDSGHCVFMGTEKDEAGNVISSCQVHPARPDACRRFPQLTYLGMKALDPRCRAVMAEFEQQKKERKHE